MPRGPVTGQCQGDPCIHLLIEPKSNLSGSLAHRAICLVATNAVDRRAAEDSRSTCESERAENA